VSDNPYQDQTAANTSTAWLNNQTQVDVDLDGMAEFARNMKTIKENLQAHTGQLQQLHTMPAAGWQAGALPEGRYAQKQMTGNAAELTQYLLYLAQALDNIGMAAQVITDAYAGTDGWSAADLNAVNFAYGDPRARPVSGLPPFVTGKTYWDVYFEGLAQQQESGSTAGVHWRNLDQVVNSNGTVTQRAVAPDGRIMETTTVVVPTGSGITITTTKVISPDGKVLSQSSQQTYSYTEGNTVVTSTTQHDADGKVTGSSRKTITIGEHGEATGEDLVNFDADGKQTTENRTVTNPDGSQTITAYSGDGDQKKVTQQVQIGQNTDGVMGVDSPATAAIHDAQEQFG
jgi:hypothetical protein